MLSHGETSIPPKLSRELSRPLIGLGIMPHSKTFGEGFTVLQISAAGNLFQQHFMVVPAEGGSTDYDGQPVDKTASVRFDMYQTKLTSDNEAKCREWVQKFTEQERKLRKNNYDNNSYCNSLVTAVDKTKMLSKVRQMFCEPHPFCSVCCQPSQTVESQSEELSKDITCERCGLNLLVSARLKELQRGNKVVTKENLKVDMQVQEFSLVTELDNSKDPLSRCLLWNWRHNVVKPLDIGVQGDDADDNTMNQPENIMPLNHADSSSMIHDRERVKESHQLSQRSSASPLSAACKQVPTVSQTDHLPVSDETATNTQGPKDDFQTPKQIPKRIFSSESSPSSFHQQLKVVSVNSSKKPRKKFAHSMGF